MAIIDPSTPVASRLLSAALDLLADCPTLRKCPSLADAQWVAIGVQRCLMLQPSGRGFLQSFGALMPDHCPELSHFFETLRSKRRLALVTELNERIVAHANSSLPDRLACFPCLEGYEVFASDGHFHKHACHDARRGVDAKFYAVGHLYSRNLRTGMVSHLTMADVPNRKKEHEMHALKRLSIAALRQGAPVGTKVIHVYDRAGIDFHQWFKWKQGSGIYMISRTKENMALEVIGVLLFDRQSGVNAGVLADELVGTSNGVMLRRVSFHDVHSGRTFEFITSLTESAVPPGVIAQLYRMRWDIEKSFDEMKNKLGESKAWGKSATAKEMQAQFICMTLNLVALLAHRVKVEEGIINVAEAKRREERSDEMHKLEKKAGLPALTPWQLVQGATQHSVKLYRWIAARMWSPLLWSAACEALRTLYARL